MRLRSLLFCLFLLTISFGFAQHLSLTPKQLIIKSTSRLDVRGTRTGLAAFDTYLQTLGVRSISPLRGMHQDRYYLVNLNDDPDWATLLNNPQRFSGIEYIQPNFIRMQHAIPNDTYFPSQLFNLCNIPQAWDYSTSSPLIIVGVVDSGMLREHPDLAPNLYVNPAETINGLDSDGNGYIDDWSGWDFVDAPELADMALGDFLDPDNDVTDENFHGTHVAGIIGAAGNNGIGVSGVCWNVKLMPLRAGFRTNVGGGYLQDDDAAAAIIYAADNGCHVINMSWGDPNYSAIIADACQYAYDKGVILVASAGNDAGPTLNYPAKLSTVISVGSVNRYKVISGFSSYGTDLDLVAPGEQIISTYKLSAGEQYFEQSGTSMSAPHVTGSVALLLGMQPGLSPDEVRSRLISSTEDLGVTGYDDRYGHGLLNTQKLLEGINPPQVLISYPNEHVGITASFDILGTVLGNDFFRYSVMYSDKTAPSSLDWKDVHSHTNQPQFYTQQVEDDVIASFYIPTDFPEGKYLIRVQYQNIHRKTYNYYRTINYDNSAPFIKQNSLFAFSRYDGSELKNYITACFNEPVLSQLNVIASDNNSHYLHSSTVDSLQVWALPQTLPEGEIRIRITALNNSELVYASQWMDDFLDIRYEHIPTNGYVKTEIGPPVVPIRKTHDFDGNGIREYIAMQLPSSGYGVLGIYEPSPAGHMKKHEFPVPAYPLDIGNTTASGKEILYLVGENAYLVDTETGNTYPNKQIWTESGISGGTLANYQQGITNGILLVKNLPTQRVIQAYQRTGSETVTSRNTLINSTATNLRNTFVPSIIVENFDNDSYPDILTADTDGDIMMFEVYNQANHVMTWNTRLPVGNAYYLTSGDYDGDGRKNFFVGAYNTNNLDPNLNFWHFEGFKSTADNSYSSMGTIMFNNVSSQNSIHSADLDADGKDEIILAISPNLYVLKYEGGSFIPVFKADSFRTYDIVSWKDAEDKAHFLTNCMVSADTTRAVEWTADLPFTGPSTPVNFTAQPANESSVLLSWVQGTADYYRIYRKDEAGNIILFDKLSGSEYWDLDLHEGQHYQYAITAVVQSFSPPESIPSEYCLAVPTPKPEVLSIQMVSSYELKLIFNQRLASASHYPYCYTLSSGMGHPHAVNSIQNQEGVLLRFARSFPDDVPSFNLELKSIRGITGVMADSLFYTFDFVEDTDAPRITGCKILSDNRSIEITFSEAIDPQGVSNLDHYTLVGHANDPNNQIVSASASTDKITIAMRDKFKHSNQTYKLIVNELKDLAGNNISSIHNIATFGYLDFSNLDEVIVYPNPVRAKGQDQAFFVNFPNGKMGEITIFNASGDLVYRDDIGPFSPVIRTWNWDLRNNNDQKVSSGIYYYLIRMGNDSTKGKLAIIR